MKEGTKVIRRCEGCIRAHKCNPEKFDGEKGTAISMDLALENGWKIEGGGGSLAVRTRCQEKNLEALPDEVVPYWGESQNSPEKPLPKAQPKPEAVAARETKPFVGDFGYGPACSECRAMRGETHIEACEGKDLIIQ